jgi:REP-associated tyrosine transposase
MCPIQMRHSRQLELTAATWGGRRDGAGRKPGPGRRSVPPRRRRQGHDARCPAHVTLRATAGLPSLRGGRPFAALTVALGAASGAGFRVLQFSVQSDHLHMVVEAAGPTGLVCALQGLAIRAARAINRALGRRGTVWGDRYHARSLATPREVRNALVYVLNNWRKHVPGARGLDPRSSAAWFDGWRAAMPRPAGSSPVAAARTWLARVGWRRHGAIDVREAPRAVRAHGPAPG